MSLTTFPSSWVGRRRSSALLLALLIEIVTFTTTFASPAGTWRQLSFGPGATPGARSDAGVIYDGYLARPDDKERLILFGGTDGVPHNDLWSFDFRSEEGWRLINPIPGATLPPPRFAAAFVSWGGGSDRVMAKLTGGQNAAGSIFFDKWDLSLLNNDRYSWQSCSGYPAPTPRIYAASTSTGNSAFRDVVIVGGTNGIDYWDDAWEGGSCVFQRISYPAPMAARVGHTILMDSPRDRIVLFGGFDGTTYHNDLWSFDATTRSWLQLPTSGPMPDPRRGHTIVFDKTYSRWLLFGGFDGTSYFNDLWALDLSGAPTWTQLDPGGPLPPSRSGHVAMWDPFHGKMIIYGGFDGSYLGDTWVLEFPTNTGVPPHVSRVELHPAYPNPFNPTTMIGFELPSAATVRLRVVDAGGRLVRELMNERRPEGPGLVTWDGLTGSGVRAGSGVYSCILEVGSERRAQSIVLVK